MSWVQYTSFLFNTPNDEETNIWNRVTIELPCVLEISSSIVSLFNGKPYASLPLQYANWWVGWTKRHLMLSYRKCSDSRRKSHVHVVNNRPIDVFEVNKPRGIAELRCCRCHYSIIIETNWRCNTQRKLTFPNKWTYYTLKSPPISHFLFDPSSLIPTLEPSFSPLALPP